MFMDDGRCTLAQRCHKFRSKVSKLLFQPHVPSFKCNSPKLPHPGLCVDRTFAPASKLICSNILLEGVFAREHGERRNL